MYLAERLDGNVASVTRIARGIPVGGDLEYADEVTLIRALQGRRAIDGARTMSNLVVEVLLRLAKAGAALILGALVWLVARRRRWRTGLDRAGAPVLALGRGLHPARRDETALNRVSRAIPRRPATPAPVGASGPPRSRRRLVAPHPGA